MSNGEAVIGELSMLDYEMYATGWRVEERLDGETGRVLGKPPRAKRGYSGDDGRLLLMVLIVYNVYRVQIT